MEMNWLIILFHITMKSCSGTKWSCCYDEEKKMGLGRGGRNGWENAINQNKTGCNITI